MASIQQQKNNAITELPVGGSVNQVLAKATSADYDVEWQTMTAPVTYVGTAGIVVEGNIIRLDSTALAQYELPTATTTTLGAVKVGNNLTIDDGVLRAIIPDSVATTHNNGLMSNTDKIKLDGIATGANNYTLPVATSADLGGVKIGAGIDIANGVISVGKATDSILGLVKAGTNITIDHNGVISATDTTYIAATTTADGLMSAADKIKLNGIGVIPSAYAHPGYTASPSDSTGLYKIKVDNTGHISEFTSASLEDLEELGVVTDLATTTTSGLLSPTDKVLLNSIEDGAYEYTLPIATTSVLGGVKVGSGLSINTEGTLSVVEATDDILGGVQPDGSTITINRGVISAVHANCPLADSDRDGLLSAGDYTLLQALIDESDEYLTEIPTATASDLGGIKIGDGLEVSSGVVSVPTATNAVTGIVKPDGTTITINDGVISATNAGTTYTAGSGITITNSIISSNIAFAVYPLGDDDAQIQLLRSGDAASYFNLKAGNNIQLEVTNDGSQRDITITSNHGHAYQELSGIIASNAIPVDNITVKRNTNNPSTIYVPTATGALLGLVKPDNDTITIDANGVISATAISETEYALTAIPDPVGIYIKLNDDDDAPITLVAGDNITLTANDNVVTIASTATSGGSGGGTTVIDNGGSSITIDSRLSSSSSNPVRNSVIYSQFATVNSRFSTVDTKLSKLVTGLSNIGVSVSLDGGNPVDTTINAHAIPYDTNTLGIDATGKLYVLTNATEYTAGTGIEITDNVITCDLQLNAIPGADGTVMLKLSSNAANEIPAAINLVPGDNISFDVTRGTSTNTEDASSFEPLQLTINSTTSYRVSDFDEDIVLQNLSHGQILRYDNAEGKWVNKNMPDFNTSYPTHGQILKYNDGLCQWINADAPTFDCRLTNLAEGDMLVSDSVDGTLTWVNTASPHFVTNNEITTGTLTDNQVLAYDSTSGKWINKSIGLHLIGLSITNEDVGKILSVTYNQETDTAEWGLTTPVTYTAGSGITISENQISADNTELELFCELQSQVYRDAPVATAKKLQYDSETFTWTPDDSAQVITVIASPLLGDIVLPVGTWVHVKWFNNLATYVIIGFDCQGVLQEEES